MAPLRSLGNIFSAFDDFYARTGKDAVTPDPGPFSASGGDQELTITGYKVHIFTTTGPSTFVVSGNPGPVEYLVVAGGGSGGGEYGGGGGAGGLRTNLSGHPLAGSSLDMSPGTYAVTVGAGGVHVSPSATRGVTGSDSSLQYPGGTITAFGGGGGGAPQGAGRDGGSGGGGGAQDAPSSNKGTGNTPPQSPPQGNPGGTGAYQNGPRSGGGGGGAGAAGDNATDPECGDGGIGVQVLIAGNPSPIGTTGPTPGGGWFAGGGGGGGYSSTPGTGGAGGGANGGGSSAPDATANTGGGGGGANHPNAANGGDGGSGIVVVRYPN
jgi:hypothetical protein